MFKLPLLGIRVLDLTMSWAGPYATRLLADMGAEVIKIEAVRHWDLLRSYTGQPPTVERVWDRSPYFNHYNRNKYGCSLDLTTPRGRELFLKLAEDSDIVIENYRAEAMENLGLSYEVLRKTNPQLIVVSMPGHGKDGPESGFVAYGTNVEQLDALRTSQATPTVRRTRPASATETRWQGSPQRAPSPWLCGTDAGRAWASTSRSLSVKT